MDSNIVEILHILQEEAAEVIQAVSKVNRFGRHGKHPQSDKTNLEHLEEEIGDLLCMVTLLTDKGIFDHDRINRARLQKVEKLKLWSKVYAN